MYPRTELLRRMARLEPDPQDLQGLRELLQGPVDWEDLLRSADGHALVPLASRHLQAAGVSPEVLAPWKARAQDVARQNLFLAKTLVEILGVLEGKGIHALPYKGPLLALCAYGDLGARRFVDLDLLVRQEEVGEAVSVLTSLGYALTRRMNRAQEDATLKHKGERTLFSRNSRVFVDLHWRFLPSAFSSRLSLDEVRRRAGSLPLCGRAVPTLSLEDLLLVLCMHGSKHYWLRWGWLCDVAELVRRHPEIRWEALLDLARSAGAERMLLLGLALARDLLAAPLEEPVAARIGADPALPWLVGRVRHWLATLPAEGDPGLWEGHRFHRAMLDRAVDRGRYSLEMALRPTVTDWDAIPLPSSCYLGYYALRPLRLGFKYGLGGAAR